MPPAANYYHILHLSPAAKPAEVEAAYRRLARRYHPDLNKAADATAQMQALNEAYAVLRDPHKRAAYDRQRAAGAAEKRPAANAPPKPAACRPPPEPEPEGFQRELAVADIRARLLELNDPEKPYTVVASGRRIILRPRQSTGYRLEITFDEARRTARLIEVNPAHAMPRLRREARQLLAAHRWRAEE